MPRLFSCAAVDKWLKIASQTQLDPLRTSPGMQVLLLGHQLLPEHLQASTSGSPSGTEVLQNSLTLATPGAADEACLSARTHKGPTAKDVDRAIKAIEGCIAWQGLQAWVPPQAAPAVRSNGEASQHLDAAEANLGETEAGCASATVSESKSGPCIQPESTEHSIHNKPSTQNPAGSSDGIPQDVQAFEEHGHVHI